MTDAYPHAEARRRTVLVAVMNNPEDLHRAAAEGWYRIPQRRAPRRIGADYLAFYQTGAFRGQPEAWTITYFAATRRYRLVTRRQLLPEEADHPRADDYYFCIEIGPLQRLERPIPSATLRRITFIHTTLARLLEARDVRELYLREDPFEKLWHALREYRLRPLPNRIVGERPLDITLRARGGYLGIQCTAEESAIEEVSIAAVQPWPLPERWALLHLPAARIQHDLNGCLQEIGAALLQLGGSMLNQD
ncbi:hypothetical protein FKZ61_008505 [Litorilinea aerophila]|uniref:hypothetical protein n=1 Tax=Litorilinea aerophila TaxID=1204385 RepID=UPI001B885937|nr:hypothetical protein [Litorilinea aerophila]MCC9076150.1 hypothetical protein [Litorilinea aerophila]GIV78849.1 MAG: hypothetical protein KatS3mg050_3243 [Litorilinea sp.]